MLMHLPLTFWFEKNSADVSADLVVILRVLHEHQRDRMSELTLSDHIFSWPGDIGARIGLRLSQQHR